MAHPCAFIPFFATGPARAFADARIGFFPARDSRIGSLPESAPSWVARPKPGPIHRPVPTPAHSPYYMNQRIFRRNLCPWFRFCRLSRRHCGWRRPRCGLNVPKETLPAGRPIELTAGHAFFNCLHAKMSSPVHRRASSAPFELRERIPGLPCPDPTFNCERTLSRLTVFFIGNFSWKL